MSMDPEERVNLGPRFRTVEVPCEGRVGDLIVLSPLDEGEFDGEPQGSASLWVCIKANWDPEGMPAVWARVQFDGVASCGIPVALPPQDRPRLHRG
jgi:hypothetical protein